MKYNIWNKIKQEEKIEYSKLQNYIYSTEYIKATSDVNDSINYFGEVFNSKLFRYFFEVEEYKSEDEYEEIFFQSYLDKNISKSKYIYFENKFLKMMNTLFEKSRCYVFCSFVTDIETNYPLKKSNDIQIDKKLVSKIQDEFTLIGDKETFMQLCYLASREIATVVFVFSDLEAVLINSGLHGYLLSENKLNSDIEDDLSKVLTFKPEL